MEVVAVLQSEVSVPAEIVPLVRVCVGTLENQAWLHATTYALNSV